MENQNDFLNMNDVYTVGLNKVFNDTITLKGHIKWELFDGNGKLKDSGEVHNTLSTYGKNGIIDQLIASPAYVKPGWCAVGTGSPAPTLLGAEIARVVFDSKTFSGSTTTMVTTFPAGTGTGTLTECGLFDVVTANTVNMWAYGTIAVTKAAADSLVITWNVSYT
jgi:hypothetical protein